MTVIEAMPFDTGPDEWAHVHFTRSLHAVLKRLGGGNVCELGGGARPALELEFLHAHDLSCLVVDVSDSELRKAPAGYRTLLGDVSSPGFRTGEHDGAAEQPARSFILQAVPQHEGEHERGDAVHAHANGQRRAG